MTSVIQIINQRCKQNLQTSEQCLDFILELKSMVIDPNARSISSYLNSTISEQLPQDLSVDSQILYHAIGVVDKEISAESLKRLDNLFTTLHQQHGGEQPFEVAKYRNTFMNTVSQMFGAVTMNADVSLNNALCANSFMQQIRVRCGNDFKSDFMDLLITKKDKISSDFMLMAPIITQTFGESGKCTSAAQICSEFQAKVKNFESAFGNTFISAIRKCFNDQLPPYVETTDAEFLLGSERREFSEMIFNVFEVRTQHPLHFYQSYFTWVIQQIQLFAQISKPLEYCIQKLLNGNALGSVQNLFYVATLKNVPFGTMDEFITQMGDTIKKFNKASAVKLNELCQFAAYDQSVKENSQRRKYLIVKYDQQVFVTAEQNVVIQEQLVKAFQPEAYFTIEEHKSETDTYQAMFVLDALIRQLYEVLNFVNPGNNQGLFEKLEQYGERIMTRICSWFGDGKKPSLSQIKADVKKFSADYICQQANPFQYFSQQFATAYQITINVKPYDYECEKSEVTDYLTTLYGYPYHNICDFYQNIILPFTLKMNANQCQILKYIADYNELQFLATLEAEVFGDTYTFQSIDQFKYITDKQAKIDLKDALIAFGYEKKLYSKSKYVYSETIAEQFKNLGKVLKYDLTKAQACDFVNALIVITNSIRAEMYQCAVPQKNCLVGYIEFLAYFKQSDPALCIPDDWVQIIGKTLLYESYVNDVFNSKTAKYDQLKMVLERFCTECAKQLGTYESLSKLFSRIDPQNTLKYDQFLQCYQEMAGKISFKQEKQAKEFAYKLQQFYQNHKKVYGNELQTFASLVVMQINGTTKQLTCQLNQEEEPVISPEQAQVQQQYAKEETTQQVEEQKYDAQPQYDEWGRAITNQVGQQAQQWAQSPEGQAQMRAGADAGINWAKSPEGQKQIASGANSAKKAWYQTGNFDPFK
ncbi:Conserved_hypothetical protein [Hexamita inflata]|uniref:Uncharacterized protein n=1 Tax=Hexamita inflata TaxID=28002 RepID=A0AA86TI38_9EUKA|nr:Conserved hypothetical protein [Hexamita inflata]